MLSTTRRRAENRNARSRSGRVWCQAIRIVESSRRATPRRHSLIPRRKRRRVDEIHAEIESDVDGAQRFVDIDLAEFLARAKKRRSSATRGSSRYGPAVGIAWGFSTKVGVAVCKRIGCDYVLFSRAGMACCSAKQRSKRGRSTGVRGRPLGAARGTARATTSAAQFTSGPQRPVGIAEQLAAPSMTKSACPLRIMWSA